MFKKIFIAIFSMTICVLGLGRVGSQSFYCGRSYCGEYTCPSGFLKKAIEKIFPDASQTNLGENDQPRFVHISGRPMGFTIDGGGVVVVSLGEIKQGGKYIESPCKKAGIKLGDILVQAEGQDITSGERLIDIINSRNGQACDLKVIRDGDELHLSVEPSYDEIALSYRLGVWVRDSSMGVGTLTYIDEQGNFGALGHPVCDIDTGTIMPVGDGRVYNCSIVGVKKGQKGEAGELKGLFLKSGEPIGSITKNTNNGLGGMIYNYKNFCEDELVEVMPRTKVKVGKAQIYTTIEGSDPKKYDIEIIKTNHLSTSGEKCMVIKITDNVLIEKTGGIVQGMSGSPVLQDGKFVGCVTHVFINDPSKGFAEFVQID